MLIHNAFGLLIENINESVVGINKEGRLIIINKAAEKSLGLNIKEDIGKNVKQAIPETQLLRILRTGQSEYNQNFNSKSREFITNRIPLTSEGVTLGAIAIFQDVTACNKLKNQMETEKSYINILNTVINTVNECIVVVDKNGIITMMSEAYKEFIDNKHPEGMDVEEVIENSKLKRVLETGKVEIGELQKIKGNTMVSMRVPIIKDNEVIGAVGKIMFKDVRDLYSLFKKVNVLQKEVQFYKNELNEQSKAAYSFSNIIGDSPKTKYSKEIAKRAANTDSNVLILGESGTGKELFANAIHNASKRYLKPFVKINCAAIPHELLESELFGYVEGAFTGARKSGKKGKFELADGGTLLLDEIGDMPMDMQVKLLRVLQEREIEPIGSTVSKKIDVRIIAATNIDIEECINKGCFRKDLYYRLNVMKVVLPPLRERKEDIPELANELRIKIADRLGIYVEGISKEAIKYLTNYDWPGNIRELENVIERAINFLDSDLIIKPKHLPEKLLKNNTKGSYELKDGSLKSTIQDMEKGIIYDVLKKNGWNKNKTAKILGISRAGLYKKIDEYNFNNV